MDFYADDDHELDDAVDKGPRDPASSISIAALDDLPEMMSEIAFVWRPARFFASRPYSAEGYEGAAFRNGNGDFFEIRSHESAPKGSCLVFSSVGVASTEEKNVAFKGLLDLIGATGVRNLNAVSFFDEGHPYRSRRDDFDSLVALETLFDLVLREVGRALPGVVSKDQIQAIIEANWSFPKGDLKLDGRSKVAAWLSSYEMLFDMWPSGYQRRSISFDGARRITLRDKGVEYLRERAFLP